MLHTRALLKTLGFMFLPSLSVLIVIFFWFFSFTNFINFIISGSIIAGIIRLIMIALEFIVGYKVYEYYRDKFVREELISNKPAKVNTLDRFSFDLGSSYGRDEAGRRILYCLNIPEHLRRTDATVVISETADPNIFMLERKITSND